MSANANKEGERPTTALCLDIGSGTQDVLYYIPDEEIENCPKFVLPSPAVLTGHRIARLTRRGRPLYLHGHNMGGGFYRSLKKHLDSGLKAAAHPEAALGLSDDLGRLDKMGITLTETCPPGYSPVMCTDFDPGFWSGFLAQTSLDYPDVVLAAVQDHGFHPKESNRLGRFQLWKDFIDDKKGRINGLLFETPPENMTRLVTLQKSIGGGMVTDTGAAAVLGALFVDEVQERSRSQGVTVVNLGNSHTIAFLVYDDRILGVYEHHTGLLEKERLCTQLERFRKGKLNNEDIFDDQGHGCVIGDLPSAAGDFQPTYILGPRRRMLRECGQFLAPGGDMMLAGCFGLVKGARLKGVLE